MQGSLHARTVVTAKVAQRCLSVRQVLLGDLGWVGVGGLEGLGWVASACARSALMMGLVEQVVECEKGCEEGGRADVPLPLPNPTLSHTHLALTQRLAARLS